MLSTLLHGIIIGLSIAMPVGPIGLLCIRNALTSGFRAGFIVGLGAACADCLYGALAAFGVTAIATILSHYQTALQLLGAAFLCYLGVSTYFAKVCSEDTVSQMSKARLFLTTFLLTLTNPLTILSFAGIFAALGAGSSEDPVILVWGVFMGSMLWWLVLSGGTALFKAKMDAKKSAWINRASGTVLFGFGLSLLKTLLST